MLTLDKETLKTIIVALNEQFWATKNREYFELSERLEKRIKLLENIDED